MRAGIVGAHRELIGNNRIESSTLTDNFEKSQHHLRKPFGRSVLMARCNNIIEAQVQQLSQSDLYHMLREVKGQTQWSFLSIMSSNMHTTIRSISRSISLAIMSVLLKSYLS